MTRKRIAVIDDEAAVRDSLCMLLGTYGLAAEPHSSASGFLASAKAPWPDCILVDVNMPGLDGLSAQRLFRDRFPGVPVIVITGYGSIPLAVKAMREGAAGFIEKPVNDVELHQSIMDSISNSRARQEDIKRRQDLQSRYELLTAREKHILSLVAEGHTSASVAANLGISKKTVDHHRASIMTKLEATSVGQLIRFSLELG